MAESHAPRLRHLTAGLLALAVASLFLLHDLAGTRVDGRLVGAVVLLAAGAVVLARLARHRSAADSAEDAPQDSPEILL